MSDLLIVLPHLGAGGAQKVGLLAADIALAVPERHTCAARWPKTPRETLSYNQPTQLKITTLTFPLPVAADAVFCWAQT